MKKAIIIIVLIIILTITIIFGVIPLVKWFSTNAEEESEYANIAIKYLQYPVPSTVGDSADANTNASGERLQVNWSALTTDNKDAIGWIKIPDTPIDYPVVEDAKASLKYLKRSFYGKKNACGAIFTIGKNDYKTPQKNIVIYGHHMGRGRDDVMFGSLVKYKDEEYWKEHDTVYFDTPYRQGTYKVFAAFNVKVKGKFKYEQTEFDNDTEFIEYVATAKSLTPYDTGIEVSASDDIITLSTCDRSFARRVGRFVVMAVRVK